MKHFLYILITLLLSPLSFAADTPHSTDLKPIELLVKVKYVDVENGFYGFEAVEEQRYLPTNMPESFQEDGLIVRVFAVRQPHIVGIHMWGEYIRIISIQTIDCEEETEDIKAICQIVY